VSAAQLLVLQRLAEYPAPSVNDLAERTYTHQSTVSVVVSRLVRRGLVRRGRSGRDGRRTSLALTASGRALLDRAMNVSSGRLINALDSMSTARLRAMLSGLAHVVTALGTGTTPTDAHPTRAAGVGQLMRKRARPT
jgi:DNA-binding MarR family transcriptional regulator